MPTSVEMLPPYGKLATVLFQKCTLLPQENEKDLFDFPEYVKAEMEFIFVVRSEDVLAAAIPAVFNHLDQEAVAAPRTRQVQKSLNPPGLSSHFD